MRDDELRAVIRQYGGDVLRGLMALADVDSTVALADALGITRQVLEQATQKYRGRLYRSVRRSIEAQLDLSQYLLDELLPEYP